MFMKIIKILNSLPQLSAPMLAGFLALGAIGTAQSAVIFCNTGLTGGCRWDADPRVLGGLERSLDGGLRYSVEGGSYTAFRDAYSWDAVPSVANFQQAIDDAFGAWTIIDPVSGLGTDLSFVSDFATAVSEDVMAFVPQGAEIDIHFNDFGDAGRRATTQFFGTGTPVTLTSGTPNYAGTFPISGADIRVNNNPGAIYTLDIFRRLLAHEIGHAIGLGDVEGDINGLAFIDDNYDGSDSTTAHATLTNSWAALVDPLDPAASPLSLFQVPDADPGVDTFGVDILMESRGLGIGPGNPLTELFPLRNDDFGGRQFLYPVLAAAPVPEPGTLALFTTSLLILSGLRRRRHHQPAGLS